MSIHGSESGLYGPSLLIVLLERAFGLEPGSRGDGECMIFATSRAHSMKRSTGGVRVRFFSVTARAADVAARLYAERLSPRWKRPVVVENRPGAEGLNGVTALAGLRDDHVLLFSPAAPISVFPFIHEALAYDPVRDLVPISSAIDTFGSVAVTGSLKAAYAGGDSGSAFDRYPRRGGRSGRRRAVRFGWPTGPGKHRGRVRRRDRRTTCPDRSHCPSHPRAMTRMYQSATLSVTRKARGSTG